MIQLILLILSLHPASYAEGKYKKDFTKQIYVNGVGQIKLVYRFTGEPVSRPRGLQIWIKCPKSKEWDPVGEYQMCELNNYELDAKGKTLNVSYNDGRADPNTGKSFCDVRGEGKVDLAPLCKE